VTPTRRSRRRRGLLIGGAFVLVEAMALRRRTGRLAGRVVVRCRKGHLFTTIWVPGASLKSVRLGPWRLQRCPVGRHWTLVTPVRASELTEADRRRAGEIRDARIP
jgi:hypothetical protein